MSTEQISSIADLDRAADSILESIRVKHGDDPHIAITIIKHSLHRHKMALMAEVIRDNQERQQGSD